MRFNYINSMMARMNRAVGDAAEMTKVLDEQRHGVSEVPASSFTTSTRRIMYSTSTFMGWVPGLVGLALINILPITTNPAVQLPWATPTIISVTMQSGPLMGLVVIVCIAVTALLYLPFFKVADQQAYEEEQAIAASKSAE